MYSGHLPDYLINVNFWLLVATAGDHYDADAWYPHDGKPVPAAEELKRLATTTIGSGSNTGNLYLETLRPAKLLKHYVLLPLFEWGTSEWHWRLAGPLVRQENASCGYSLENAAEAERVTLVGDENEISQEVADKLKRAGCVVSRMRSSDINNALRLEDTTVGPIA
jgi:hypothetical protein